MNHHLAWTELVGHEYGSRIRTAERDGWKLASLGNSKHAKGYGAIGELVAGLQKAVDIVLGKRIKLEKAKDCCG